MVDVVERQSSAGESSGPRGAGWVVAAFYLFAAYIFTSWAMDDGRSNYASSAPAPTHHSMNAAAHGDSSAR